MRSSCGRHGVFRKQRVECALGAARILRSAVVLAGVNDQGVELIVQRGVGREVALEETAELFVTVARLGEFVTFEQAAGVGIDNEDRMFAGIEKNGVGGFWAYAVDFE